MRVISWNVNSVRTRLPRLLALLARHQPDVVCLQETKVEDKTFPLTEIGAAGYRAALHGQRAYNGVAILSKTKAENVERGFPNDPVPTESRVMSATFDGVRIVNAYVVNGEAPGTEKFAKKLAWLDAFGAWLATQRDETVLVVGDFNVTPDDRDVHDAARWHEKILCSTPERERVHRILAAGYADLLRVHTQEPGIFTWWDYRMLAFAKGWGLRIDLALGTPPIAARCTAVTVDREERKETTGEGKPSDHAPLIVDLA